MNTAHEHHSNEVLSFIALCNTRGVGFETLNKIARERIPFSSFFDSNIAPDIARLISLNPTYSRLRDHFSPSQIRASIKGEARRTLEKLNARQITVIFPTDDAYPRQALNLSNFPRWLFVEGDVRVLGTHSITAVGSRKTSAEGKWLATYFGFCIRDLGIATVSGLADGIDQIVHRASLAADLPTIAVLGTGIMSDYPKDSHDLRRRIVERGGAIVTEYLPDGGLSAKNFVQRNRIQAALGNLVFPIEWAAQSGTAHTVRFACDLERPLAFVRTPTQPNFDWIPKDLARNSQSFTLPADHDEFMTYLQSAVHSEPTQLRLI